MNTCEKYGNTFSITKYGVKTYVDSKRRCLLCRSAPGRGIGTGRRPAGSYHSEQYREPAQPDVICAAITSQMHKAKLPTHVELNCDKYDLAKDSVVLLEQLRTIDKKRLKDKVCHLDHQILLKIDKALEISLELYT